MQPIPGWLEIFCVRRIYNKRFACPETNSVLVNALVRFDSLSGQAIKKGGEKVKIFKIILILVLLFSIGFGVLGSNKIIEFKPNERIVIGMPEFPSEGQILMNLKSRVEELEISVSILETLVNQIAIQNGIKIERFDNGYVKMSKFE